MGEEPSGRGGGIDSAMADLPFRQVAERLSTPCWISDAVGRIVWVNDAWIDYTGMTVDRIKSEGLRGLHDPQTYGDVADRWVAVQAAGEAADMPFPLKGKDGLFRPFQTRVVPLRDSAGRVTRWFGTNTDMSAQSDAEARLQLSEEQLREVFDRAADAIFITNAAGLLVDVNAAACAMGQYTRDELLTKSVWNLVEQDQQAALADTRGSELSLRDWRIRRKDGTLLSVEVSSRLLSDGRRLGVARDVTDRRRAEQAERHALTDLVSSQTARASEAERQLKHFWESSRRSVRRRVVQRWRGAPDQ